MPDARRILLIDDDPDIVRALDVRLRVAGYSVATAHDGYQGLAAAAENPPDAIVLDIRMPSMDGLTVLAHLRERQETKQTPVVILSASIVDREKAFELEARYFLEKPYDAKKLVAALDSAINESKRACATV